MAENREWGGGERRGGEAKRRMRLKCSSGPRGERKNTEPKPKISQDDRETEKRSSRSSRKLGGKARIGVRKLSHAGLPK